MRRLLAALALVTSVACLDSDPAKDYGDPTALSTPTDEGGITAWVVSPTLSDRLDTATPDVVIAAYAYEGEGAARKPKPLLVQLGRIEKAATGTDEVEELRPAVAEGDPGEGQRFRFAMPLVHGQNRIQVRIETLDRTRVRRISFNLSYEGADPGVTLAVRLPRDPNAERPCDDTLPIAQAVTNARRVCVSGRVTSQTADAPTLQVGLSGYERVSVPTSADGRFVSPINLPRNQRHVLEARVTDSEKNATVAQLSLVQDEQPPTLEIASGRRSTANATLDVEGTAFDLYGLAALEIQNADGAVQAIEPRSPFTTTVRLGVGSNALDVVARDVAGNETREPLSLTRVRTIWLDGPTKEAGATQIEVDRFDLGELLTEDDQKELDMAEIPLNGAVEHALERIREPERFGIDPETWGQAEKNMQRILTMTPDTADLRGTSMEELLRISDAVGLPTPRVLSDILDIGVTAPFIDPDVTAEVLMDLLVGSHPNVQKNAAGEYVIAVSMFDVFEDMATLAARFGPSGEHPGFLEGESYAAVLEPGFLLTLPVKSNLVQYDGVDLTARTKDFLFVLDGERVLDFNVLTDEFVVVGLADEPTIDLRFKLLEHPGPGRLVAGASRTAAEDASDPGFYRGNGQGFGVAPWLFEHIAVEAGYRTYHRAFDDSSFARSLRYDAGSIQNAATITWNRGWVTIDTAGGIGAPPAPLYAWDLLMEVAQVRLHDNGDGDPLPEGQANMAFSLEKLSIGVTAEELIEKLRPKLAEQETKLSELFVGELGLASSGTDFFYAPADGQDGALLFRAEGDSQAPYTYEKPGFYADIELTQKVSTTGDVGGVRDPKHEKVSARLGQIYFVADETGAVFQIEITERKGTRIGLEVQRAEDVE